MKQVDVMSRHLKMLKSWLSLIRIGNAIALGYAAIVGYVLGIPRYIDILMTIKLFTVAFLIGSGSNAINDYYDRYIDQLNKPWRPIPSGLIDATTAYVVSIALLAIGVALSFSVSLLNTLIALVASVLSYLYSQRLKKIILLGNVIVAFLTSLAIIYGGLASNITIHVCIASLYAFLLNIGREFLKGIEDVEGDKRYGVKTLATVLGSKNAFMISMTIFLSLILLSLIPYFDPRFSYSIIYLIITITGVDTIIVIALIKASSLNPKDALKATKLLKIPVFCGISAFFFEALRIIYGISI